MVDQALLQARPGLGRGQRLGVELETSGDVSTLTPGSSTSVVPLLALEETLTWLCIEDALRPDAATTAIGAAMGFCASLVRAFQECDAAMIEINPLVVTKSGELVVLDGAGHHPQVELPCEIADAVVAFQQKIHA